MSARIKTLFWLLVCVGLVLLAARASAAPPVDLLSWVPRLRLPAPVPVAVVVPVVKPAPPAPKPVAKPVKKPAGPADEAQQAANGACSIAWLRDRLWWRETSYNAGPGITEAIKANHGHPKDEYCGHTQAGAQRSCGLPIPNGSGGSYNWFLNKLRNVLLGNVGSFDKIKQGYKIGIYNPRKKRIAHITAADVVVTSRNAPAKGAWCIGGNEGSGTKAGMHRTWYPKANIYAAANYNY